MKLSLKIIINIDANFNIKGTIIIYIYNKYKSVKKVD